jgi:ubiquinone/menaquinone biosynthesis C-methylase UbiE
MLKTGHHLSDEEIRSGYEALVGRGGLGPEFIERVLALAGDSTGLKILDVGCGKGELLAEICARFPASEVHGVDFSTARLRDASRRVGLQVALKEADIQKALPFPDASFDRIFCTETLEHLKEPHRCLREMGRVLKADGRMILTIPNASGFAPFNRLGPLIPGRWLRGKLLPYEHPSNTDQPIDTCFAFKEIMELVRVGGFEVEAAAGYRYFRYLQMLPAVRDVYRWIYPGVEWALPKLCGERFAYNLLLRCRKARRDGGR